MRKLWLESIRSGELILFLNLLDSHRLRFSDIFAPVSILPSAFSRELHVGDSCVEGGGGDMSFSLDTSIQECVNFRLMDPRVSLSGIRLTGFLLWIVAFNPETTGRACQLELHHLTWVHKVVFSHFCVGSGPVLCLQFFDGVELTLLSTRMDGAHKVAEF